LGPACGPGGEQDSAGPSRGRRSFSWSRQFPPYFLGKISLLTTAGGRAGLRPEKVRLAGAGAGRAAGALEEVVDHGTSRRCTVRLDDGRRLVVRTREAAGAAPGDRGGVDWADLDLVPLRA